MASESDAKAFDADVADDMGEDFAKAFEELTSGKTADDEEDDGADPGKDLATDDGKETAGDDAGEKDKGGAGADEGDTDPDKKAPPAQGADGKDAASQVDADKKEPPKFDWSKASPEEQRAAFEAAQSELDKVRKSDASNKGRVSALSRVKHLSEKLGRLSTTGADSKAVQNEVSTYLNSASFKAFKELNPELAEPFEMLANTMSKVTGRVADEVTSVTRETRGELLTEQGKYVVETHPDYAKIIGEGSPEQAQKFGKWVQQQPRYIREAVARNGQGIIDGEEVADVIGRYKQQHGIGTTQTTDQGDKTAPGNDAGGKDTTRPGDNLRNRRRQSAPAVHTKGPGASNGPPNDFDAAFEHEAKKRDQQAKRK